jgi:flagellar assembly factor FliW
VALVSPRRYLPQYQLRVARRDLAPLQLADYGSAKVLAVVGKRDRGLTLNLRAPLVINPERRLGRQVLAYDDLPICHPLESGKAFWRKSA